MCKGKTSFGKRTTSGSGNNGNSLTDRSPIFKLVTLNYFSKFRLKSGKLKV